MGGRELLAEGREAEVFLQADGSVLKLMREPSDAARVDRELAVLEVLAAAGVPAPRVQRRVTVDGRPGLVTDRVPGTDLLARLGRNPLAADRVARALARAHAALHEVAAPSTLPDLKADLRARIERAGPLPADLRGGVLDLLDGLPGGDRLCHGDLHPGNLLGSLDEPVAIDWGDASRGDPLADVVRTAVLLRVGVPPPGAPRLVRILAPVGRALLSVRYVHHYRRARPIDTAAFARWRVVRAAARLAELVPEEHPALLRIVRRDLRRAVPSEPG